MNSKIFINSICELLNLSIDQSCKIFNIKRASFYRYASGINQLKLDDVSKICEKLKISISYDDLSSNVKNYLHLIHEMNQKKIDEKLKYFNVSVVVRNILEFEKQHPNIDNVPSSELIVDHKWRVFYKSFLKYMGLSIEPEKLDSPWVPFGKLRNSQKNNLDSIFAKSNILLPKGELQWV